MIKQIYEFLLWDNCRNNCSFCYHKIQKCRELSQEEKENSIEKVYEFLQSDKFVKGSHILLVGGELFDSPSIFLSLRRLISYIVRMMECNEIDLFYVNTNLIYKKLDCVEFFIQELHSKGMLSRLKFTTSYDIQGRFSSEKLEHLMLGNLKYLTTKYPNLNVVVNMMLARELCAKLINKEFSIKKFCTEYRCAVNLIPYIVLNPQLQAPRADIFNALLSVDEEIPGYLQDYIRNLDLPQRKLLYSFNGNDFVFCSSNDSPCGHSENFKRYSPKNTCFICDLKSLFCNE